MPFGAFILRYMPPVPPFGPHSIFLHEFEDISAGHHLGILDPYRAQAAATIDDLNGSPLAILHAGKSRIFKALSL